MVKLANSRGGVNAHQAQFSDLDETHVYDGIWANFSLLHAARSAFPLHLEQIARALKPDGIFHIGMKTIEGERRDHLGRNYTFYSDVELRALLKAANFESLHEATGKSAGLAGTIDPWIEILARLDR